MAEASRDQNHVTAMLFVGSDGLTYNAEGDEATGRLKVDNAGGGEGTVTEVSVVTANGFAGTVADETTTPAITLTTTITGILSGNGTAISAASTTGSGAVVLATSPTLVTPALGVATATSVNGLTITSTTGTLTLANGSTLVTAGSNSITLTSTGATNVTLPTTGTLMTNPMTTGGDLIYGGASGVPTRLANGTAGQILTSNGTTTAPTWEDAAGGGNVSNTGTPLNNQLAVWTNATTIEGDADLTWDATTLAIAGNQTITVADTTNIVGLTITNNDVTNSPNTADFVSAGWNNVKIEAAGSGNEALLELYNNFAVTGGNDVGAVRWFSKDSAANKDQMGEVGVYINDETATSEDSVMKFVTRLAGTFATRFLVGDGINGVSVGASTAAGIVESNGNQDLILQTGNATTSDITIVDGANGQIQLNPDGLGSVVVTGGTDTGIIHVYDTAHSSLLYLAADATYAEVTGTDGSSNSYFDLFAADGNTYLILHDTAAGATGPTFYLEHFSASPAADDSVGRIFFDGKNSGGTTRTYGYMQTVITSPTASSESSYIQFGVRRTGTLTEAIRINGDGIQLPENKSVQLDPSLSADGTYTGITIAGTAGATLAFGDLCYLAAADSRWELADADAATTSDRMMGMCVLAAAADGDPTVMLLIGQIRADAAFPALTIGSAVYVGETAGDIQVAIPTGADNVIRRVGYALTADEIYFNPSMDSQITVA